VIDVHDYQIGTVKTVDRVPTATTSTVHHSQMHGTRCTQKEAGSEKPTDVHLAVDARRSGKYGGRP
jgi:hypothetical protein